MDLHELLKSNIPISVNIGLNDLKQFASSVAAETIEKMSERIHPKEPRLYTRVEVLKKLNICPTTLWNYEQNGIIAGKRIGNRKYFTEEEINKLIC